MMKLEDILNTINDKLDALDKKVDAVNEKLGFRTVSKIKKVPMANGQYTIAKEICKKCGGLISWDGWEQGQLPTHITALGQLQGDGSCPKWEDKRG